MKAIKVFSIPLLPIPIQIKANVLPQILITQSKESTSFTYLPSMNVILTVPYKTNQIYLQDSDIYGILPNYSVVKIATKNTLKEAIQANFDAVSCSDFDRETQNDIELNMTEFKQMLEPDLADETL